MGVNHSFGRELALLEIAEPAQPAHRSLEIGAIDADTNFVTLHGGDVKNV
jgi:hypothetical protein